VVLSVLFWGQANAVMNVKEAKKYYPLFGIGANVALLVAGQVQYTSSTCAKKINDADNGMKKEEVAMKESGGMSS